MFRPVIYTDEKSIPKDTPIIDAYSGSLKELFFIEHPRYKKEMPEAQKELKKYLEKKDVPKVWIYYPWRKLVVFTVPEVIYHKLRTARNRDLITDSEQARYRRTKVGIIGMSIGSSSLEMLIRTGGAKNVKIADFDEVEVTNLNRMNANLLDVGSNKSIIAARRMYEIDPFLNIQVLEEEIVESNLDNFINHGFRIDIVVDAMDSLDMKIKLRLKCREYGIPVLMATSNGDGIIIDIERYDKDNNLPLFHGLIRKDDYENIASLSTRTKYNEWLKLATKIVNPKHLSAVMQDSLIKIGDTIAQVPQLGSTVAISGASISYLIRLIANDYQLDSGRYLLNLDDIFQVKRKFNKNDLNKKLEDKLCLGNND